MISNKFIQMNNDLFPHSFLLKFSEANSIYPTFSSFLYDTIEDRYWKIGRRLDLNELSW